MSHVTVIARVSLMGLSSALDRGNAADFVTGVLQGQLADAGATFEDEAIGFAQSWRQWPDLDDLTVGACFGSANRHGDVRRILSRSLETIDGSDVIVDPARIEATFAALLSLRGDLIACAVKADRAKDRNDYAKRVRPLTPVLIIALAAAICVKGEDALEAMAAASAPIRGQARDTRPAG